MKLDTAIVREFDVSEHDAQSVAGVATKLVAWWDSTSTRVLSYMDPKGADKIDEMVVKACKALSEKGVQNSLSILAWSVEWLYKQDHSGAWDKPENIKMYALVYRVTVTAFALAQFRDTKRRIEKGDWIIEVKHPDGGVARIDRTFPMWGYERLRSIASAEDAVNHYRSLLKERRIM